MIDPRRVMPGQEQAARDANMYEALTRISEASEKIGEHTGQLETQSEQLKALNDHLAKESEDRAKGDRSNRWFTLAMTILSFLLGLVAAHWSEIIEWAKSL